MTGAGAAGADVAGADAAGAAGADVAGAAGAGAAGADAAGAAGADAAHIGSRPPVVCLPWTCQKGFHKPFQSLATSFCSK